MPGVPDVTGFLRWAAAEAPGAAGYWPCQALATYALSGVAALDTATTTVFGDLYGFGGWQAEALGALGITEAQLPVVVPMGQSAATVGDTGTVIAGGTIDALCDQLVCDAAEPGDVLAIFGATLVVWIVTDEWVEIPGLVTVPHTVPGRVLVGGPSNAGALFGDWARTLLRGVARPGPRATEANDGDGRSGTPTGCPSGCPTCVASGRRSTTRCCGPACTGWTSPRGRPPSSGPPSRPAASSSAGCSSGPGSKGPRVVASGGGTRVEAWMSGVADATGLPVDTVAVPEGAAYGAAFVARMAAGLEPSLDDSRRWAATGRRVDPDPVWAKAASARYRRFEELGPGT